MEIIIKIDDDLYTRLFDNGVDNYDDAANMAKAIRKGTPLPKDHGRLIDADKTIKVLKSLGSRDYRREKGTIQEAIKMLSFDEYTPTIIEANEESEG